MKWYEDYNSFFEAFVKKGAYADETTFYFKSDSKKALHYIGCLPEQKMIYWAGYCDILNGAEFATPEELFNAKIYDGKSIKERWNDIVICEFGGISVESPSLSINN